MRRMSINFILFPTCFVAMFLGAVPHVSVTFAEISRKIVDYMKV